MNIIVLQHIKIEDPGYIKDLMLADGFKLTTIELDEGEKSTFSFRGRARHRLVARLMAAWPTIGRADARPAR